MVRILLIFLILTGNLYGQVVLSEILSNEPGGRVRLEWVEIFNRSNFAVDLSEFIIIADSDTNYLPENSLLASQEYAVLARQLLPIDGSDSFESYWGDSSGVWGDAENEYFLVIDIDMTLSNNSGFVVLKHNSGILIDSVFWSVPSDDGRSIEKDDLFNDYSGWHDCFDPDGSTPGRINSVVPQDIDETFVVEINPRDISQSGVLNRFTIDIVIPPGTEISLDIYDESGHKVKTLLDESDLDVIQLTWDGRDNDNRLLQPGVYLLSFKLEGLRDDTKLIPVVIAP